jgi:hypothetical protein
MATALFSNQQESDGNNLSGIELAAEWCAAASRSSESLASLGPKNAELVENKV